MCIFQDIRLPSAYQDGVKFRVRRRHEFNLVNVNGAVQPFYLNKFCDTTSGNRVRLMARTNRQLTADEGVGTRLFDVIVLF